MNPSFAAFLAVSLIVAHQLAPAAAPGQVLGWGMNDAGQASGRPSLVFSNGTSQNTHITSTTEAFSVSIDNRRLTNAIGVCAGPNFSLALLSDTTIVGWGDNQKGEAIGSETPFPHRASGLVTLAGRELSNIVSVAAGRGFGIALRRDGTVVGWGQSVKGAESPPQRGQTIV